MSEGAPESESELATIVVGTDFSPTAALALERAKELAREHDARIVLAHAITLQPFAAGGPELGTLPRDFEYQVREASVKRLDGLAEEIRGDGIEVEAKGGCINTRHAGQLSKLRKHLYEAVGMLLDSRNDACRLIAAVPRHPETERVAERMAKRCHSAGIEIALVSGDGSIWIVE